MNQDFQREVRNADEALSLAYGAAQGPEPSTRSLGKGDWGTERSGHSTTRASTESPPVQKQTLPRTGHEPPEKQTLPPSAFLSSKKKFPRHAFQTWTYDRNNQF